MDNPVKRCAFCKQTKPLDCFSLDKSEKDGHQKRCKQCWHLHHPQSKYIRTMEVTFTQSLSGWTKWGDSNKGLVQEKLNPEWVCQACGEKQVDDLPPYMFEYPYREYIRICAKCEFEAVRRHIEDFFDLIQVVR